MIQKLTLKLEKYILDCLIQIIRACKWYKIYIYIRPSEYVLKFLLFYVKVNISFEKKKNTLAY